jgi:outer membrane protein assembly factor BamB
MILVIYRNASQMKNNCKVLSQFISNFSIFIVIVLLFPLYGCDMVDELIDTAEGKKKSLLIGDRISVLLNQRTLKPDPKLVKVQIQLPAPAPNPDWPQAGGFPNHAMHHVQVADSIKKAWSVSIGNGSDDEERLAASPVIANGRIYTIDALSVVSAYKTSNGALLWEKDLTPEEEDDGHIPGGIAYNNGRIFISTGFAEAIALNAKTGKGIWREKISGPARAAPTVRGGRVFILTVDNKIFALNAKNGKKLWSHTEAAESSSLLGSASPAAGDGVVIVPYTNGNLIAFKSANGRILWQNSLRTFKRTEVLANLAHIRGRPIIDRGKVFAISHAGLMASYDLQKGRPVWQREVGGLESPWIAGDYIFILTNDLEIAALSRDTGSVHWVRSLPRYEDPEEQEDQITWTGPILVSDRLIVAGSHGKAIAVSPYTGRMLGSIELPDGVTVPPVVAGGSVYFLADDAQLVAYR